MVDGKGGNCKRCLKWGGEGGGGEVINKSFRKHLKTGGG